jgi:hypothetical protein
MSRVLRLGARRVGRRWVAGVAEVGGDVGGGLSDEVPQRGIGPPVPEAAGGAHCPHGRPPPRVGRELGDRRVRTRASNTSPTGATLARDHLRAGEPTPAQISARTGSASPYAFAAAFRRHHGIPPGQWRQKRNEKPRCRPGAPEPDPRDLTVRASATVEVRRWVTSGGDAPCTRDTTRDR